MKFNTKASNFCLAVATLLLLTVTVGTASAKDFYGFSHTIKGLSRVKKGTDIQPTKFELNEKGGVFRIRMPNSAGTCEAEYEFNWEFLDDVSRIEHGKKYRFKIVGSRINGDCKQNTNGAWALSANSFSPVAKKAGMKNPGNTIVVTTKKNPIHAYPVGDENVMEGTITAATSNIRDESLFTLRFSFASFPYGSTSKLCEFDVVYVYKKNLIIKR